MTKVNVQGRIKLMVILIELPSNKICVDLKGL